MGLHVTRAHPLTLLALAKVRRAASFGVGHIALVGSTVRHAAYADSDMDMDVLASFDGAATSVRPCIEKRSVHV